MNDLRLDYLLRQAERYCDMIDEDMKHYRFLSYLGELSEYDIEEKEVNIKYYNNKLYHIWDEYDRRCN